MNKTLILANRFREVIFSGTWIANTNFKNELSNINWKLATKKVDSFNTIALLAQHIHYYINGINNVFRGGQLEIKDKYSFDFSDFQSQSEWECFLEKFWNDAEEFSTLVERLSDLQLEEVFVQDNYGTYQRNIDAMIEHAYYHLGQIVMLKKFFLHHS